jgi:hypothetical protein
MGLARSCGSARLFGRLDYNPVRCSTESQQQPKLAFSQLPDLYKPPRSSFTPHESRTQPPIHEAPAPTTTSKAHLTTPPINMSGIPANFWSSPIRYLRWASYEKPALFWSVVIGSMGPPLVYVLPIVRRRFGDEDPPFVPHSYPGEFILV